MGLFILTETSAGYALFKARDSKLLKNEALATEAETAEGANDMLKLKQFVKFDSAATALEEVASLTEGKVTPMLAKLLDSMKDEKKGSLAVADAKLATAINKLPGLTLQPISDASTNDVFRAIRQHLPSLIPGLLPENIATMSLGLSHSLSRHKVKFSPDKVDTMIVQAIALLDDLDKELNTYAMRVKEWYGWHFPEMARIINDNLALARVILKMGMRTSASTTDLSDILPEEIEAALKAAAEVSMGTEITDQDLENIKLLAEQVVGFTEYRQQLSSYLSSRMQAIAPNLTELVGELVGARLIAHAGSLMSLAKSPGSTIQILGAEKALFRALKTKHDTPKYGLIYHASLVGQATGKNKGKIARMLASKAAIGIRVDALSSWSAEGEGKGEDVDDETRSALGVLSRAKIERHLRGLEGKPLLPRSVAVGPNGKPATPGKWDIKEARKYNADADGLTGDEPAHDAPTPKSEKKEKKDKKEKKSKKIEVVAEADSDADQMEIDSGLALPAPDLNGTSAKPVNGEAPEVDEKAAKKARKAAEKLAKKAKKESTQESKKTNEELAALVGLSLSKFEKKLAKGEIQFSEDGVPLVIRKKEQEEETNGKRKRDDDDTEKSEKKKKKKSKA